ncbi:MAG TPA: AMP-binding protein [Nocardioides sp.]|nr:AMP-binding protein [Nocardioides sp.]
MTIDPVAIEKRPRSLVHMFLDRVAEAPDEDAFYYPVEGGWQESTWSQTHTLVEGLAAGLLALGIEPEDRVALVASTRYEAVLGFLATLWAGGAVTAVSPAADEETLAALLIDSGARVVIAEDYDTVRRLWRIRGRIRAVAKVVQIDGDYPDGRVLPLEGLLALGRDHLRQQPRALSQRLYAVRRHGLASLPYVTGEGGRRGVRLSHAALTYHATALAALGRLTDADLLYLPLPLTSVYAQSVLGVQLVSGFPVALEGRADQVTDSVAVVRPTVVAATPSLLQDVRTAVEDEQPRGLLRRQKALDKRMRSEVRSAFGDRLRFVVCAGGDVDSGLADFFEEAGVTVLEAYGRAETGGAVSVALPDDAGSRTAGLPLPGTHVRISAGGEILVAGPGLMDAYHARRPVPAKQAEPGWLRTGDAGVLDTEGRLRVLGRYVDRASD